MDEIYERISELSRLVVRLCEERGLKIATAESCTGGMISAAITSVSGSSAVIELGVCSYSNRVKREVLGVSDETLERCSEYSTECAEEMAIGVLELSGADFAVSTSGVAGPSGGSSENPVGTVYISVCGKNQANAAIAANAAISTISEKHIFNNNGREYIRAAAAEKALSMLLENIKKYIH